jgi:hypothetical protein
VKNLKEQIYVYNQIDEIEERMEYVMQSTEDLDIFYMKRMLRNLKYLFPETLEEIDPHSIREGLLTSKTKTRGANANKGFVVDEQSKFETYRPDEINQKLDQVNKTNNDLRETEECEKIVIENGKDS